MQTIYRAKRIITLHEERDAQYVAVRDGRIVALGDRDAMRGYGEAIDERFADHVIVPGFVEAHAHAITGGMWRYLYVGAQDRTKPDGSIASGLTRFEDVLAALKRADAALTDPDAPLIAWGFDPMVIMDRRAHVRDFDRIVPRRPLLIVHSNFHLINVNTLALNCVGYAPSTPLEGLMKDSQGALTGEIAEMAAKFPVYKSVGFGFTDTDGAGLRDYATLARHVGVTTGTDLFAELNAQSSALMRRTCAGDDFPMRLVAMMGSRSHSPKDLVPAARDFATMSHDKLRLGSVKLMTDGSIQGFSARLNAPGYLGGQPNGIWNTAPQQLAEYLQHCLAGSVQAHVHANGDEAIDAVIDGVHSALAKQAAPDHRTVVQHCQMATPSQFASMAKLGICANLFANHLWYFGDVHVDFTLGPARAARINATRTALNAGVPIAIHSDSPVTPLAPLFTAWCATERRTPKGRVLGEGERLTPYEALHAITLGAAYTLKMEHEIGSLAIGKRADFTVLDRDPLTHSMRDVKVLGTVLGGRPT